MSQVLGKAALVVGAVALVATGVGAIVGAAAVTTALGVSAATLTAAAGALSVASAVTAKKPNATSTGSPTQFTADPQAYIPYIIGRTGSAGNIVARFGYDTADKGENDRQAFVTILSICRIHSFERFEADRQPVSFAGNGAATGTFAGFMWQGTQLGQSPEAGRISFGDRAPPGYSAQHKLSGYAAASWVLRFDTKAKFYQAGVPAPMWVVNGVLAYDPRRDSTYPGGEGPQRVNDEATWEFSQNPYVHGLTWVLGRYLNGKRVMGLGARPAGIDIPAFVEGANIADANGWKVGGVIYSGDGKWATLKKILQAGMGEPLALGATISCLVNTPRVSLATVTIADVVGDASVTATQPRRDRINTITPRYRLEENNWQLLPGSPISVAEHVTADGGKRSREQDYPLIQQTDQVATAVRYDIENAREFGPIVLPLKPVWMGYKPGDCVDVVLPELGLNGQQVLLLNRDLDPASAVTTMTARSETTAKHAFALGQTTTPPMTPGVTGAPLVPIPASDAWAITDTALASDDATLPALIVTGAVDIGTADAIVFEYRPFVTGQGPEDGWRTESVVQPATTRVEISSVSAATAYEVAVSYRVRGVIGARLILGPVTTAALSGSAAVSIILTNENHTLPADRDGLVTTYEGASGDVRVFIGATDVSDSFVLSTLDNPQALSVSYAGQSFTVTGGLDAAEDAASLTIRATGSGPYAGVTVDKVFSLSKSRAGADGAAAKLLYVTSTSQTLTVDAAGALAPAGTVQNITFKAIKQGTDAAVTWTARDETGAVTNTFTGDTVTLAAADVRTIINNPAAGGRSMTMTATLTDDGQTLSDIISVAKVQQGAAGPAGTSAYAALLSNESHTLGADAAGNVSSYAGAGGTFRVFVGGADVSSSFALSTQANPQALAVTYNGQSYTVTGGLDANEDAATLTIRATGSGAYAGVTLDKVFSLAKSKAGADGTAPPLVSLAASSQTVRYDTTGAIAAGQSITFTAIRQNTAATPIFTVINSAGVAVGAKTAANWAAGEPGIWTSTGPDVLTRTATGMAQLIADHGGTAGRVTMQVSAGGVSDSVSFMRVQDGAAGPAGASAYAALLSNESHTLAADTAGNVTGYAGAGGAFRVFVGGSDVSASFALSTLANPQALAVTYSGQSYSVTGGLDANEDAATLTIRATGSGAHAGIILDKVFSLAKSKAGANGASPPLVTLAASTQTVRYNTAGAFIAGQTVAFTATRQNTTATPIFSVINSAGVVVAAKTAADYVAENNGFWTSTGPDQLTRTASGLPSLIADHGGAAGRVTMHVAAGGVTDQVSFTRVQDGAPGADGEDGAAGASAYAGLLSNESHTVAADAAGNVTSYAGASGAFRVFLGGGDVSSSFALSTIANPQGLTVAYSGQAYTVSGGLDAGEDAATLTIRATGSGAHAGVLIDKVFSLAKSKTGASGASPPLITLAASTQTVRYDGSGQMIAGQSVSLTATRQNTTSATQWTILNYAGEVVATRPASGYTAEDATAWTSTGPDQLTRTAAGLASLINSFGGPSGRVTFRATSGSVSDQVSIQRVQDGAAGSGGTGSSGYGPLANNPQTTVSLGSSSTTAVTVVSVPIANLPAGGRLRLRIVVKEGERGGGTSIVTSNLVASIGGQQLWSGIISISPEGVLNDNAVLNLDTALFNNPTSGNVNFVITSARGGPTGNSGSYNLAYYLERVA